MSTMYMYSRSAAPFGVACYGKFLLEALKPSGVRELPEFDHAFVKWSNSVVFFDTAHAGAKWLEMVKHYCDQGNIVVVIYDENGNSGAMVNALSEVKDKTIRMLRTWEANIVRAYYNTALNNFIALSS